MSSFAMVLLEEGVDVEFPADLDKVIGILDQEIPWFSCDGFGYCLTSAKGTIGNQWEVLIKLADQVTRKPLPTVVGRILLERTDSGMMRLRVPPRASEVTSSDEMPREEMSQESEKGQDDRFFASFVSQLLNTCQRHDLIQLPGVLPTF